MPRRRTLKVELRPVIQVEKHYLRLLKTRKKVVYFIRGDKKYKYLWGRSRVLYIGQTRRTGRRPFESLGWKAPELLRLYGMKKLEIVYVEAPPRKRVNILKKLDTFRLDVMVDINRVTHHVVDIVRLDVQRHELGF